MTAIEGRNRLHFRVNVAAEWGSPAESEWIRDLIAMESPLTILIQVRESGFGNRRRRRYQSENWKYYGRMKVGASDQGKVGAVVASMGIVRTNGLADLCFLGFNALVKPGDFIKKVSPFPKARDFLKEKQLCTCIGTRKKRP